MSTSVQTSALSGAARPQIGSSLRVVLVAIGGVAAAALTVSMAAANPYAAPGGAVGALARAVWVLAPIGTGIYVWTFHSRRRLAGVLLATGFAAALLLLNGSADPALFGVARILGYFAVPAYSYLMLSFPEGRLHTQGERRVVAASGAVIALCWVPLVLITRQPVFATALVRCAPHCPRNVFFVGASAPLERALTLGVRFGYATLLIGVVLLLIRRAHRSTAPMRRTLAPAQVASFAFAGSLALYLASARRGGAAEGVVGWLVIVATPAVPIALLIGLLREQLFARAALSRLVARLPDLRSHDQIRSALASAFQDKSLDILYWQARGRRYVNGTGTPVALPGPEADTASTLVEKDGQPVAAVLHDQALSESSRLVGAIAAAAMMSAERARLESDLRLSRRRLVHAGDLARERIEHDLHDGAQQELVALRVKLALAAEAVDLGAESAARMVAEIGADMESAVDDLRELAQGIYPPLLAERGLGEALDAVAWRSRSPTTVRAEDVGRADQDVEAAVYFCCLEALQNASKHGGRDAPVSVRLWRARGALHFDVADRGRGFDERLVGKGSGLANMRDRIGAVGGQVTIWSAPGRGTSVAGSIPLSRR